MSLGGCCYPLPCETPERASVTLPAASTPRWVLHELRFAPENQPIKQMTPSLTILKLQSLKMAVASASVLLTCYRDKLMKLKIN